MVLVREMETIEKIKEVIDYLRPFIMNEGGNIEFVKYEDNIVYVKMQGACADCSMQDLTLKDGLFMAIKEEAPEVKDIISVQDNQ